MQTAVQCQRAESAYFTSEQILHLSFAEKYTTVQIKRE